ncbi:hypothetical protein GWD52_07715 [Enterobacteriaceae bacterium 4M9]|nr:hypothetical protein [Enterobacteriaceae bacterium 4M9]
MNKYPLFITAVLALFLSGCDNGDKTSSEASGNAASTTAPASQPTAPATQAPVAQAPAPLSTGNGEDIKTDLSAMGEIINNNEAEVNKLRENVQWFNDKDEQGMLQETLAKSRKLQESANRQLLALKLKSEEGQALRVKMVDSNKLAIKMAELAGQENVTDSDKQELEALGKEFLALQMETMQDVNALAVEYDWK